MNEKEEMTADLYEQSISAIKEGKIDQALVFLQQALDSDAYSTHPEILFTHAQCLFLTQQYQDGLEIAKLASSFAPNDCEAYSLLGKIHFHLNHCYDSKAALLKAIALNDKSYDTLMYIGLAEEKLGNGKAAEGYFRQALLITPEHGYAQLSLARLYLYHFKRLHEARDLFKEVTAILDRFEVWYDLSVCHRQLKEYQNAYETTLIAIQKNSNRPEAFHLLGVILEHLDSEERYGNFSRCEEAKVAYKRALSIRPDQLETIFNLATLYEALEDDWMAEKTYQDILSIQENEPNTLYNLGRLLDKGS